MIVEAGSEVFVLDVETRILAWGIAEVAVHTSPLTESLHWAS